jgi:Skp family chaperone for outer membrane proteins
MAPKPVANPRKTARFYQANPDARKVKATTDTKFNKSDAQMAKRRELAKARRDKGIMGKGGADLSHTKNGKLIKESVSSNRARNRGKK